MQIELSQHFTYKRILHLTIAPIIMVLFISLYTVVDGIIIANFVSEDAFAGVNLIFPVTMIVGGFGFMFGTGGAALASKFLGEKNKKEANNIFTNMVVVSLAVGTILAIICFFLIEPIARAMASGAQGSPAEIEKMIQEAITYGKILVVGQIPYVLANMFQSFFIVDEKPGLGFVFSVTSGGINILLDFIFIIPCHMGVTGAAVATVIGFSLGGFGPLVYFLIKKDGNIALCKPTFKIKNILKSSANGASEFINQIATSIVGTVFNIQLLKYCGQPGVTAFGVIQSVLLIFVSVFIGYSLSMAPVVSYHYGAKNYEELHNILKKSFIIIIISSITMMILAETLAKPLTLLFLKENQEIIDLSIHALRVWSVHFLFCGFCIYLSSFFTALNNGLISGIIATVRTFVTQIICVLLLPLAMGSEGIWWSAAIAEALAMCVAFIFLFKNQKKYQY